jgi:Holliday junction resolvasome RuvABC endonuclease subunit
VSYTIAIDPATRFGFAVIDHLGQLLVASSHRIDEIGEKRSGKWGAFELWLRTRLVSYANSGGVDLVVFEEPISFAGRAPNWTSPQLCGIIMASCEVLKMPYVSAHNVTVKKFATGSGRAKKEDMVRAARHRWPGHSFSDDNAADAAWLAQWGMECADV